jgi:hypothetical protein
MEAEWQAMPKDVNRN